METVLKVSGNDVTMEQMLDLLFDPETGLIDPKATKTVDGKTIEAPRWGIAPTFNEEAIQNIEESLGLAAGQIEFILEKAAKIRLVSKKVREDKNRDKFVTYHRIDPDYKADNTEQLRKVSGAVDRFKSRFETV